MADFGSGSTPFDVAVNAQGERIFTAPLQKHHVIPQEIFSGTDEEFRIARDFLTRINFNGNDFSRNGLIGAWAA
jgi:hypothetical protein